MWRIEQIAWRQIAHCACGVCMLPLKVAYNSEDGARVVSIIALKENAHTWLDVCAHEPGMLNDGMPNTYSVPHMKCYVCITLSFSNVCNHLCARTGTCLRGVTKEKRRSQLMIPGHPWCLDQSGPQLYVSFSLFHIVHDGLLYDAHGHVFFRVEHVIYALCACYG